MADPFHQVGVTFGGVQAVQTWADFLLWEHVLNDNQQVAAIVELGTSRGGFSRYLWAQAATRGMRFVTYDRERPVNPPPGFHQADVFTDAGWIAHDFHQDGPTLLFCDNGDKPRELATYAPYLAAGDVVVVHDWLTEVGPDDIPDTLTETHGDLCDQLGSMSRVFTA